MIRRFESLPGLFVFLIISMAHSDGKDSLQNIFDTVDVYRAKSEKPQSILFESYPDRTYPTLIDTDSGAQVRKQDTLSLPGISAKSSEYDSTSKAFKKYWSRVEKEEGIDKLRDQVRSRDIDHSWYPHWYFFDSTVVLVPPFFILFRSKKH